MDALDQQLIGLLRTDARLTVAALAHRLKVSRGTITNRITRLEDDGVIVGYTVRLRPDAQPNEIHAWMSIAVEGNETRAVIASLLGEPGVAGNPRYQRSLGPARQPACGQFVRAVVGARAGPVDQRDSEHRDEYSFADVSRVMAFPLTRSCCTDDGPQPTCKKGAPPTCIHRSRSAVGVTRKPVAPAIPVT
jgi:DNA-binding Lrp family transcriptional regulator